MTLLKLNSVKERKAKGNMNEAKRNYKKKCKTRNIDFYLHENDLYEFSKSINFQKEVKDFLRRLKEYVEKYGYPLKTKKGDK